MNKKIYLLLLAVFFAISGVIAQAPSIEIDNVTEDPGTISVPVYFSDFTDIAAITLKIEFDNSVLSYVNIQNMAINGTWLAHLSGTNEVTVTYNTNVMGTGYPSPTGGQQMFDLVFDYVGGYSDLEFVPFCEVSNAFLGTYPNIAYTNGSVTQNVPAQVTTIGTVSASPSDEVLVPVSMSGYTDVAALSFLINFDPTKLAFVAVVNDNIGVIYNAIANPNQILITWTGTGQAMDDTIFDLKFVYLGGGDADLTFHAASEISNSYLGIVNTSWIDGKVEEVLTNNATVTIGEVLGTIGTQVSVPVSCSGFSENAGGITLFIAFDNTQLAFINSSNELITGLSVNESVPGVVGISWYNLSGMDINGTLLNLEFSYLGGGDADLTFNPGSEVSNTTLQVFPVTYVNGKIIMDTQTATASIDDHQVEMGEILIPVTFANLPSDVAAVSLIIDYNNTALSFIDLQNVDTDLSNISAYITQTPSQIHISWYGLTGVDINGEAFALRFVFNGGSSDLSFAGGCQITDINLQDIPMTYDDGYVDGTIIVPGDANCDEVIDIFDIFTTVDYINALNPDPFCFLNADVNSDGSIDLFDIFEIINIINEQ